MLIFIIFLTTNQEKGILTQVLLHRSSYNIATLLLSYKILDINDINIKLTNDLRMLITSIYALLFDNLIVTMKGFKL